jgi:hypothetical protein
MPPSTGKLRRLQTVIIVVVGIFTFYTITGGLAIAVSENIQVGRLPWLRSDRMLDAIDAYVAPGQSLARVPVLGWPLELSESFWRNVTGAPISINYGSHRNQIPVSDAPKDLIETFKRECPNAEIVNISQLIGGRTGKQFIFWIIQFKQDGKLREALMNDAQKVEMTYDVQEPRESK